MGYNNLENIYRTNFSLLHHHKWSMSDIENMVPFERDIYVELLHQHIEELKKQKGMM